MMACGAARPVPAAPPAPPPSKVQLTVLPAESDAFPRVARAVSASLTSTRLALEIKDARLAAIDIYKAGQNIVLDVVFAR